MSRSDYITQQLQHNIVPPTGCTVDDSESNYPDTHPNPIPGPIWIVSKIGRRAFQNMKICLVNKRATVIKVLCRANQHTYVESDICDKREITNSWGPWGPIRQLIYIYTLGYAGGVNNILELGARNVKVRQSRKYSSGQC